MEVNDFEYFGKEYVSLTNIKTIYHDGKQLELGADVKGSVKEAMRQLYEEFRIPEIIINGTNIKEFPDLLRDLKIKFPKENEADVFSTSAHKMKK